MRFLKRWFCNHDYKLIHTYKKDVDDGVGYSLQPVYVIYCPKCAKRKEVLNHEYIIMQQMKKVDESYDEQEHESNKDV
ncbi:hypothetical protein PQE68_gp162 [Bacillus phage vB_BanS_Sophrita]|uniref:Uncharacterized protein n=1 Tax=Bacillus phage vB_BanS_Sophrita TaxID=2894790 RepID=A0AAE8YU16_9CAUD|nr:hypothetical protein PQE68_gp162 [Bacillus phage vB_BanS_Sophrita]UGO50753.1 hypothetical protein SOPHRITA_162 [Bacillus phage vB_BanS_Sophrita]